MKMLYINPWDMDVKGFNSGSAKKSISIIKGFNDNGIETFLYNNYKDIKKSKFWKIKCRLPYTSSFNELIYDDNKINGYDAYYIRFLGPDKKFIEFLKKLRMQNKNAKILLEFPDIDYIMRFQGKIKNIHLILKDINFTKNVSRYVDRVILMSPEKEYKGIKAIFMMNGIDTTAIKKRTYEKSLIKKYVLASVSSFQEVHGIDYVIRSLKEYINNGGDKLCLKLVGGGPLLEQYKKLIQDIELENYVEILGPLYGDDLAEFYNKIHCGIEFMAPERRSFTYSSSLKSREYFAKGLPFITAARIDVLENNPCKYVLQLEKKENNLFDLNEVELFLEKIYNNTETKINEMTEEIRKFSEENLDVTKTIKSVIAYLKSN